MNLFRFANKMLEGILRMERNLLVTIIGYASWQILFTVAVSPLGFGVLTLEQMGFSPVTALWGIITGAAVTIFFGLIISTRIGLAIHAKAFEGVKTKKEFEDAWSFQLHGCYDGFIAEPHWSGAVFSLFLVVFSITGIPFPFSVAPAILCRWLLHVFSHLLFPTQITHRAWGSLVFTSLGLLSVDAVCSVGFVISKSISTPIIVHTFFLPFSELVGSKKRVANKVGITLE